VKRKYESKWADISGRCTIYPTPNREYSDAIHADVVSCSIELANSHTSNMLVAYRIILITLKESETDKKVLKGIEMRAYNGRSLYC
jgi:hypothetical protein